ncbi:MAG TPA: hypothetical protein VIJ28_00480 [Chloroflexota bacterium]|jgi:hypothetical protein
MTSEVYRRRRLRLGALLYQLGYFAALDSRDEDGQVTRFRHDSRRSVEIAGTVARLFSDESVEVLDLEACIIRCKEALRGGPFHRPPEE